MGLVLRGGSFIGRRSYEWGVGIGLDLALNGMDWMEGVCLLLAVSTISTWRKECF